MTLLFWLLLIPAAGTLAVIAWATIWTCEAVERRYRRWLVRAELAEMKERQKLDALARMERR